MKKLVVAGCSHSTGYGLEDSSNNWVTYFGNENNLDFENLSEPGTSIQYAIHKLIEYIINNSVDIVILQLTTLDRYPIPVNGRSKFIHSSLVEQDNLPYLFHLLPANYLEAVDGKSTPIGNTVIKYFFENVTYSDFYIKTLIHELILLETLIESRNARLIVIPYDEYFFGKESNMSIWKHPYSENLKLKEYIDYPFKQWLKDNYNPEDYFVDKGFHLTEEGHALFANEYLKSFIKI